MKKLTKQEALELLNEVYAYCYTLKGYRLGQAIFNLLPQEIYNKFVDTDNDFFYWTDEEKVLQVFWTEYVEHKDEQTIEEYTEDDKRIY